MLKIYASREEEARLLPYLAEFHARVVTNYPIKGRTRKIQGKNAYKVVNFPITACMYNHDHLAEPDKCEWHN